jgi:hypothetical protein
MEIAMSRSITTLLLLLLLLPLSAREPRLEAAHDDALVRAMASSDAKQVKIAVEALAAEGTSSAMEQVISRALLSGNSVVEDAALVGLRNLLPGSGLDWLCTQATAHPRKEVRDLLLGFLSKRKESQCFRAVLQGLYDEEDSVALKAIESLQGKAHPGSIPHMVRALQHQEDRDRDLSLVAERIRQMLKKLTGADLFASSEWDALWKGNKKVLGQGKKLDPAKITLKGSGVKIEPPAFFGQELVSEKIVFVLDTSISMQQRDPFPEGQEPTGKAGAGKTGVNKRGKKVKGWEDLPASRMRLRRVQKELKRMIRELPRSFKFCLVTFDEDVDRMSDQLVGATPDQKRRALKFIDNFDPDGLTSTDRALDSAFKIPGVRTIVLLSDGMPYRAKDPIDVMGLLEHIEALNRFEHIPIHTVGFASTSGNAGGFLEELSRRTDGTYTEVP